MLERFSLLDNPWLPMIRASGHREIVRPADLTNGIDCDPLVDIDWPRADFRCATLEFLIGLLTVACPPRENDDWQARWKRPPSEAELEAAFAPLMTAFAFDGNGPRAYQDFEELTAEPNPVEGLLIEAPGAAAVKKNTALLVKSGRVEILSRPAAAIALLTLQTMAPAGGAGHRTSLRGGGPLTTLVLPQAPASLWHLLWANVPRTEPAKPADLPRIFPWLGLTRLSNKEGRTTTPNDVDLRQAFFGMPRRIQLDFEPNVDRLPCDLTGHIDKLIVHTYRTRPHGTNYDAWGGVHPLTPHYHTRATDPIRYPVHGQDGRLGYRQWGAMLYGDKEGLRVPAACVSLFVSERNGGLPRQERRFRLMAAGYAMDNMKALAFVEAETPLISVPDAAEVTQKVKDFVAAAKVGAEVLVQAVKTALYGVAADKRIPRLNDKTPLTTARDQFWADTNDEFFEELNELSALRDGELTQEVANLRSEAWRRVLHRATLAIFDDMTPVQDPPSCNLKRVVEGRRLLVRTLLGFTKRGAELYKHLQLPVPETKTRKGKAVS